MHDRFNELSKKYLEMNNKHVLLQNNVIREQPKPAMLRLISYKSSGIGKTLNKSLKIFSNLFQDVNCTNEDICSSIVDLLQWLMQCMIKHKSNRLSH